MDWLRAGFFWPPLTTIEQNQAELGALAVKKLVEIIEEVGPDIGCIEPYSILIKPRLLTRLSTARQSREVLDDH